MTTPESPNAEDVSVGDTGPVVEATPTRTDIVKYAGASGDFNPLHHDETYATEAGYDSVFSHGMLTASIASNAVADWLGLANVTSFSTRFVQTVWPGDTITTETTVADKYAEEGDTIVEIEITVTNQDDETVLTGAATAALPSRSE